MATVPVAELARQPPVPELPPDYAAWSEALEASLPEPSGQWFEEEGSDFWGTPEGRAELGERC